MGLRHCISSWLLFILGVVIVDGIFLTATNNGFGLPGKKYFIGGQHIFNGVTETFRCVSVAVVDLEQKG